MKRKFFTNLLLLLFLNLLIKPFWIFGIDRSVQNVVGTEQYGFYFSLLNFSFILNILLDIGTTNYNNREIARHNHLPEKYFSSMVGLKFFLALFYAITCITLAFILGYDARQMNLLYFLILNQFLTAFLLYLRSNISGLLHFKTDSVLSVLDKTIMIILCSLLLWGHITNRPFQIEWFVYAQTLAVFISCLIALAIVVRYAGHFRPVINKNYTFLILKQSYPYAILILLMSCYNRVDSVMLERLLPDGKIQAGIYAQSYRILDACSMFAFLFAGLLLPIFSKMLSHKEPVGEMTEFSYLLLFVPAVTIAVSCLFFRNEIVHLLYTSVVDESPKVFGILMLGFIGISTTYIFGTLLTAGGNLKQLNRIASSAVILNICLNLLLIPRYKALGAACSSLATQTLSALAQMLLAKNTFRLNVRYKIPVQLLCFLTGIIFSGIVIRHFVPGWIPALLIFISVSMLLAFVTRLIRPKILYKIIYYQEN